MTNRRLPSIDRRCFLAGMEPVPELSCGFKLHKPGYRFATDRYDHFQVIVVRSGRLLAEWPGQKRTLTPNTLLLLPPATEFTLWCTQTGYQGIGINASHWPDSPARPAALPCHSELRQLAGLIEGLLEAADPNAASILQHLGAAFCAWSVQLGTRLTTGPAENSETYWAERARQALENNLSSDRPIRDVFKSLGLCYRQLSRHFTTHHGLSPKRYQLLRRVEEAERLLRTTDWAVTDIALELGFGNSQHFATRFRQVAGRSPTAIRRTS